MSPEIHCEDRYVEDLVMRLSLEQVPGLTTKKAVESMSNKCTVKNPITITTRCGFSEPSDNNNIVCVGKARCWGGETGLSGLSLPQILDLSCMGSPNSNRCPNPTDCARDKVIESKVEVPLDLLFADVVQSSFESQLECVDYYYAGFHTTEIVDVCGSMPKCVTTRECIPQRRDCLERLTKINDICSDSKFEDQVGGSELGEALRDILGLSPSKNSNSPNLFLQGQGTR